VIVNSDLYGYARTKSSENTAKIAEKQQPLKNKTNI